MKKTLLSIICFCVIMTTSAQNASLVWAKNMGGSSTEQGRSIAIDPLGNVYTTGSFQGVADFDPGAGVFNLTSMGSTDIFVSKVDASGNFVWSKSMGSTSFDVGTGISVDATGNAYITGYFNGTVDFDPGAGTLNITSAGSEDIFISKLDASGNIVWAKNFGGTFPDYGYGITLDGSGNICANGWFDDVADFDPGVSITNLTSYGNDDAYVLKLDASGNLTWAKNIGGTGSDYSYGIATDPSGNVYTTGPFTGVGDFDPGAAAFNLTSIGGTDVFISKLDVAGNFVMAKSFGGNLSEFSFGLSLDASGNIYTTGYFKNNATDFDPGPGTYNLIANGSEDIFVSKLDAAGNFVWARGMGAASADVPYGIAVDASGVYTSGYFQNTVDFDPSVGGVFNITAGQADVFVSKLDLSGNFVWAKKLGGTVTDIGYGIALDASSNIYTIGYFNGTADFDPNAGVFNLISTGADDVYVQKMSQCINTGTLTVNSGTICYGQNFTMTPGGAATYTFQGGNAVVSPTANANYTVVGTSTSGCVYSQFVTSNITVNTLPTVSAMSSTVMICAGQTVSLIASGANTYTWNTSSTNTVLAISPTITTLYSVTGTDINGCKASYTITQNVTNCTGFVTLSGVEASAINVFPNPTTGIMNVELGIMNEISSTSISSIQILNTLSQVVFEETSNTKNLTLNINNYPQGIYFIKIGAVTKKIIKE